MKLFGFEITRTKQNQGLLSYVMDGGRSWFPLVREPFAGAWQRNISLSAESVLTFAAVYACVTLIASDIGKLRITLLRKQRNEDVWEEEENAAYTVLRKPNRYQTRIMFLQQWIVSKKIHGNTYVLKQRNEANRVEALYVLDPTRVRVLVSPDGAIYYELSADNLTGLNEPVRVPAREIIHDVEVPLYHPLCGVSPLTACGSAALQGLRIQGHSSDFFERGANPGGILTSPGFIEPDEATKLEQLWEQNYGGNNSGRVAVLGGGFKFEKMAVNAVDAQLIEQLKWTAENVCTAFHVPPYMIGVAPPPPHNNVEALTVQYYNQCLQNPIESIEVLLDEGLDLANDLGTELDLDGLMRMDTSTQIRTLSEGVKGALFKPNEARKKLNLPSVVGGDSPMLQQQNYSLEALAKRDAKADPFGKGTGAPPAPAAPQLVAAEDPEKRVEFLLRKALAA